MATALEREIRRLLDKAVRKARLVAEDGARKALTELALEDAKKPEGLSPARTDLRNRLRAHARSLGDLMQSDGAIRANRLVREIAYEHWHRALFARFLAENDLLLDPEHKVAVSLSDLEQIATEERRDPIELAADWAEPMLPQIFRKEDPVLALALPPETKAGIIDIVKKLPRAVFTADDTLGWVYQFWQADEKDRVNASEVKIGADELPAVTQLFTEDYMVLFLLENTLGAWWAAKMLAVDPTLAATAASEDELRAKTSPPGYLWTYLRFVREPREGETPEAATGHWRPVADEFEGWPNAAKEITVLDPCMGSGHFLVFAMPILVAFRRTEEGLDERAAVKAVLADNLFGLEIDPRCTQIAAFALALASWKRVGGPEPLPRLNLACSGLAIGLGKSEFLKLAEGIADASGWTGEANLLGTERAPLGERASARLRGGLERLYEMFEKAPYLGSLIDPRRAVSGDFGNLFEEGFDGLETLLAQVLAQSGTGYEARETAVTAQGVAKAAELLASKYTLVATNVPYLGLRRQDAVLREYLSKNFEAEKEDVAVAFIKRFGGWCNGTTSAVVSPQNWFYQYRYRHFREFILQQTCISLVGRLGEGGFQSSGAAGAFVALSIVDFREPGPVSLIRSIDASSVPESDQKDSLLRVGSVDAETQQSQFLNPDHRISFERPSSSPLLNTFVTTAQGIKTGDDEFWVRTFWEFPELANSWKPYQTSSELNVPYAGRSLVINWYTNGEGMVRPRRGSAVVGRRGIVVSAMRQIAATLYSGDLHYSLATPLIPVDEDQLPAIWAFCSSQEFNKLVREIEQNIAVTTDTFSKVPFDLDHWRRVAAETLPNGLPKPHSNDPTQWLFDGHLRGSADPNVTTNDSTKVRLATPHGPRPGMAAHPLQVAVARLLGYRWPRQTGSSYMDCLAVSDFDEVDSSGLVDADGIVPLPALTGEGDAATRLRDLIRAVWGADYGEGTIRELLAAEESRATELGSWLADEFFDSHCRLFHQTPFIWHISDGVRGGFSALVNYHRLCEEDGAGRRLLEKLRDSYLGEWIAAQRRAVSAGEPGAEDRLVAAEHLRSELTRIIEGEPPYDIFVRWKQLHGQPIGWEPDIDDGVRLNIRPFLIAKPKNPTRRDACILRVTPRVKKHEGADRGAEPYRDKVEFPWFWADDDDVATKDFAGGPTFKGRRYNDFHYTRAVKERARAAWNKKL